MAEQGRMILKKGYGLANREFGIPNQPNTKLRIGSVTKQFTAVLVIQMIEQGKLRLEGRNSDYGRSTPRTGERVTILQLLNHTSGIPSYERGVDSGGAFTITQ